MPNTLLPIPINSDSAPILRAIRNPNEFMRFVLWFATPSQFRTPKHQKDFAALIGVNQDTLTDWKRRPGFWPLVQQAMGEWIKDRVPDVVGSLYENAAAEGKAGAVKLFLQLAGLAEPKRDN